MIEKTVKVNVPELNMYGAHVKAGYQMTLAQVHGDLLHAMSEAMSNAYSAGSKEDCDYWKGRCNGYSTLCELIGNFINN